LYKNVMRKIIVFLLTFLLLLSACTSQSGFRIYNQGQWENLDQKGIENIVNSEGQEFPALGKNWAYDQLNSVFYFTSDLIGLKPGDKFDLLVTGSGMTVLGADRQLLAYYEGEETNPKLQKTNVKLIVQGKGVWVIELSKLWEKGPWLVTGLQKSK